MLRTNVLSEAIPFPLVAPHLIKTPQERHFTPAPETTVPAIPSPCSSRKQRKNSTSSPLSNASSSSAAVLSHTACGIALAGIYVDTRVACGGLLLGGIDDTFLNVRGEGEKGLFDVDVALCADFHKGDAEFVSKGLALGGGDGALLFPVTLVADQDLVYAFGCVLLDIGEPCSDIAETLLVGNVIDEQNAHGASVVSGGDCPESLLSSGIPYLQLDTLAVELYGADLEVDANGGDERGSKRVFAEAQQAAGFTNARIANEEQLDQEVIVSCASHIAGGESKELSRSRW